MPDQQEQQRGTPEPGDVVAITGNPAIVDGTMAVVQTVLHVGFINARATCRAQTADLVVPVAHLVVVPTDGCRACAQYAVTGGPGHDGSRLCESGSIASGGQRAHCTCDTCF